MRGVRFRHKLSIVLVGLALVPLAGAGLIVQALLIRNETANVDSKLASAAAAASASYHAQLQGAQNEAMQLASRPDVARAFRRRDGSAVNLTDVPPGYVVALADAKGTFAGSAPAGPAWTSSAELVPNTGDRQGDRLGTARRLADHAHRRRGTDSCWRGRLSLVLGDTAVGAPGGVAGDVQGVTTGDAVDATIGGQDVRAEAIRVEGPSRTQLVASYPLRGSTTVSTRSGCRCCCRWRSWPAWWRPSRCLRPIASPV